MSQHRTCKTQNSPKLHCNWLHHHGLLFFTYMVYRLYKHCTRRTSIFISLPLDDALNHLNRKEHLETKSTDQDVWAGQRENHPNIIKMFWRKSTWTTTQLFYQQNMWHPQCTRRLTNIQPSIKVSKPWRNLISVWIDTSSS